MRVGPRHRCQICGALVFVSRTRRRLTAAPHGFEGFGRCLGSGLLASPAGNALAPVSGEFSANRGAR